MNLFSSISASYIAELCPVARLTPSQLTTVRLLVASQTLTVAVQRHYRKCLEDLSGWAILAAERPICLIPVPGNVGDTHTIVRPITDPAFDERGLNCLAGPLQAINAILSSGEGASQRIVALMHEDRTYSRSIFAQGFRVPTGMACGETEMPYMAFDQSMLPRLAATMLRCAVEGSVVTQGQRGSIYVDLSGGHTIFGPAFREALVDLARGVLVAIKIEGRDAFELRRRIS